MIHILRFMLFLFCGAAMAAVLGGCSQPGNFGLGSESSEAAATKGEHSEARVYYTGTSDMALYKNPGNTLIKRLAKHTKVYRDELQRGYAHVRVDGTGDEGWVENGKLIWRLPKPSAASKSVAPKEKTSATPVEHASDTDSATRPVEAAEPEEPTPSAPSAVPEQPSVAPSIFNPY
ncbi:MAG: hypothetical protein ACU843_04990 [Gammaproteobacteria bacterium]